MIKKNMSRLMCLALVPAMLLTGCARTPQAAPEKTPEPVHVKPSYEMTDTPVHKEEAVYVNLRPDGTVTEVNVTDRLHTDLPQVRVEDVSILEGIKDVKGFSEPVRDNGYLYWDMESTDLYYSGTTPQSPPIKVAIKYLLDGEEISYEKLSGKSGRVTVDISVENTLEKTVYVSGGEYTLRCPMLFVGGMILPEDSFGSVSTDNTIVIGDGAHKIAFFMGLPGMSESLGLSSLELPVIGKTLGSSHYSISADVENFALGNMMFAAVPFSSISAISVEGLDEGIAGVKSVLGDIESIMNAFSALGVNEIIEVLYGEAFQAEELIRAISETATLYRENKELLETLAKYITEDNLKLIDKLLTDIENMNMPSIKAAMDVETFQKLIAILSIISSGFSEVAVLTADALGLLPVLTSLRDDLKTAQMQESLDNLPELAEKLRTLMDVLKQCQDLLDSVSDMFGEENIDDLTSLLDTAAKYTELDVLSDAQADHLAGRMREWLAFGQEYDIFTQRTSTTSSTVIFIYKAESI